MFEEFEKNQAVEYYLHVLLHFRLKCLKYLSTNAHIPQICVWHSSIHGLNLSVLYFF